MDLHRLKDVLHDFHTISGMDIAVMDSQFRGVAAARSETNNFCEYIHRSSKCLDCCVSSDTARLKSAALKRELIVYTCPFGVFEAICPIIKDGAVVGFLFLAMGIESGEHHAKGTVENARLVDPKLDFETLMSCVQTFPSQPYEVFGSYARMLPVLADYIAANDMLSDDKHTLGQLVKIYVKNNLSRKITLADISWNLHCSTVTLTEHFKKEFGITIMQYVAEKKMFLAEKMLADERNNVNDVAEACGFSDVEYFSRCFKGYHGVSPLAWRKQHRIENERKQNTEDSAMDTGHS